MENQHYMSPRERDLLNKATADLEAFVADLMLEKKEVQMVKWEDIELHDEMPNSTVTMTTSTSDMNDLLDAYQKRLVANVKDADLYHDVNVVPFASAKIKAVIDWLDLRFTVDPMRCVFYNDPKARSYIKSFITRQTGTRHYVAHDEKDITQDGASFTIRLHDIRNAKDLNRITSLLHSQYGSTVEVMSIEAIELSLDLYGGNSSAMVIKLYKAMQYPQMMKNFRIYKTKGTRSIVPRSLHQMYEHLEDGFNIGVGDHRVDEFCVRTYFKRTDKGGIPLPEHEHRARIEVTLKASLFDKEQVDRSVMNLKRIITVGFKKMQFTKLSRRSTDREKDIYYTQVQAFGKEQPAALSRSRHKRVLPDFLETHGDFNEAKRTAVKALVKKF